MLQETLVWSCSYPFPDWFDLHIMALRHSTSYQGVGDRWEVDVSGIINHIGKLETHFYAISVEL